MVRYIVFQKVIELGGFTKAAEELGYSQSSVSQMIASLEKELGVKLLCRAHHDISLTPEGEALYPFIEKAIFQYRAIHEKVAEITAYEKRLREMYMSDNFKNHSKYPTTNAVHVYAVIAMCLELNFNLSDSQIIDIINSGFAARRNFFRRVLRCIDILPNTYQIASKWLISEHDRRVKDGSLTFDYFNVSDGKIEYCISKCAYIEMFEQYGIRSLGKIFCMTDTTSYENLPKHVKFIRYSTLSDGICCHDAIIDKQKIKS